MTGLPRWTSAAPLIAAAVVVLLATPAASGAASPLAHSHWHELIPAAAPSPRDRDGLAYDAADHYVVLYGGYNAFSGSAFSYDTWKFAGGVWTPLSPSSHPSAPTGLVLAYDPALKGVLAFGGEAPYGSSYYNDTWLFQAGNWTPLYPTHSPPARSQYAMAWDPASNEMVLFGGVDGGSQYLSDTWVFNGTTWMPVHSAVSPPGRQQTSMVYDAALGKLLLVGGYNTTLGPLNGTWAFGNGSWSALKATHAPVRSYAEFVILGNGTPLLFGGSAPRVGTVNSSFEFFGGAWHQVNVGRAPPPTEIGGMTYDPRTHYVLQFGGIDDNTSPWTYLNETWVLR